MTVLPANTPPRFTSTGTLLIVPEPLESAMALPSPNCPDELLPQAASVPSEHNTRL